MKVFKIDFMVNRRRVCEKNGFKNWGGGGLIKGRIASDSGVTHVVSYP